MLRLPNRAILFALLGALALLVWGGSTASAHDPPPLSSPFPAGQAWLVTCAYALPEDSDSDACGHADGRWSRYALDLQHVEGPGVAEGQPVLAAAAGSVRRAGWEDLLGWHVLLDHGDGYTTVYAHMQEPPAVQDGEQVDLGQTLGSVGCTGRCTGPHIHFALWLDNVSVPPEPLCGLSGLTYGQVIESCAASGATANPPIASIGSDFDGDGRHDLAFLYAQSGQPPRIDLIRSDEASLAFTGPEGWWQGDEPHEFEMVAHTVAGDFDGDGRTDLALLIQGPDCGAWLPVLLAEEGRFMEPTLGAWWIDPDYCARQVRQVASGDFDGDGLADIALFFETEGGGTRIDVLRSDGERFVAGPESWWQSDRYTAGLVAHLLPGDFNGDGRMDLATLWSSSSECHSHVHVFLSTAQGFQYAGPEGWWGDAGVCATGVAQAASGDFDGDGRADDLALLYEEDGSQRHIDLLRAEDGRFVQSDTPWWVEEALDPPAELRALLPGDFDNDGRTDLAALYDEGECSSSIRVLASGGEGFAPSGWWAADGYCAGAVRHSLP